MNISSFTLDLIGKTSIPVIIAIITYYLAKRQLNNTNVLQYRQKWIDDLRSGVSLYIATAELISMIPYSNTNQYFEHFKDFARAQNGVELLLEPDNEFHDDIIEVMEKIRDIIHGTKIDEEKLTESIDELLNACKEVLQEQFQNIRNGR